MPATAEMKLPAPTRDELAERTCDRCAMTTRWVAQDSESVPPNWIERGKRAYCLACRRELAVDEALAELGDTAPASGRATIRSQAVVDFELRRNPDRRDGDIARAARCSVMAVSKARKRLGLRRSS
jgi:hypothetical protein